MTKAQLIEYLIDCKGLTEEEAKEYDTDMLDDSDLQEAAEYTA